MDTSIEREAEQRIRNKFVNHAASYENESNRRDSIYGERLLRSPILGRCYRPSELPTSYVPPTILDTSLRHIPVYAHLKIYDLKPVQRPETPSILSKLHPQFSEDARKCSRDVSSRVSEGYSTASPSRQFGIAKNDRGSPISRVSRKINL